VVLADGDSLLPEHLPPGLASDASAGMSGVDTIVPLETPECAIRLVSQSGRVNPAS
jgi:hypothetical protein